MGSIVPQPDVAWKLLFPQAGGRVMTAVQRLAALIKDIPYCMLTTTSNDDQSLRSRPMTLQKTEFGGTIWFFAGRNSNPALDIEENPSINLAFLNPKDMTFVSVTGQAEVVLDKEKAKEFWNPIYQEWFPHGVEDPNLCLLRVVVEGADYWDSPDGKVVQMLGFAKAVLTGNEATGVGHHGHLTLS
jgi:general stress protein 26